MMINKTQTIGAFFMVLVFLFSCEANIEEDSLTEVTEICDSNISFQTSVKPIVDSNCLGCHSGSQFPNLSTFNGISSNAISIRAEIVSRRMPQGGSLSNEEIEQITCWIDSGALNN